MVVGGGSSGRTWRIGVARGNGGSRDVQISGSVDRQSNEGYNRHLEKMIEKAEE